MSEPTVENTPDAGIMCEDAALRKSKAATFDRMKWVPILNSASRFVGMFGGAMFGTGLMGVIGLGNAPAAMVLLVVGVVLQTAGIVMDFVASRVWQSTGIDQTQI